MNEFFNEILEKYKGKRIAVISHGGTIKFYLLSFCKVNERLNLEYKENELAIKSPCLLKMTFRKKWVSKFRTNEIIKNGKSVIFGTLIQLLDFIRDSYSDSEVSDKDYLNLYSSVDLLVIDDLGKEKPTEWVLEKLFLIVNNRYNNYLPIVITTNYKRNQLRERLCINKNYSIVDSIISRLYEMCGGIEIKDDDHRMSDSLIRESLRNSWDNWSIS